MKIWKNIFLFSLGGGLYAILELLWRGRTHGSMFLLGGACFLALGRLSKRDIPVPVLPLVGALLVTAGELAVGLLVNQDHSVWDYRQTPLNFLGQICLPYTLLWMPVSLAAMQIYEKVDARLGHGD